MSSLSNAIARLDATQLQRLSYALSTAGFAAVATAVRREHAELQSAERVGEAPQGEQPAEAPPADAPSGTPGGMAYSDPNAPHAGPMAYSDGGLNLFAPK